MKRERIERLAIDCAAGELNEDGEVLFRMYLAEHPEENQWAEDMMRIYEQTEAAIDAKTTDGYAGDKAPFVKKRNLLLQLKWQRFGHWAAAVIFATFIGFTVGRWNINSKMDRIVSMDNWSPKQVRTVSDLKEKYAGTFWGDKMLALLESRPVQRSKSNFDGGFWDKYKQYKGEQL